MLMLMSKCEPAQSLPCEKYAMKNEEVLFDVLHDNYCNWQGLVLSKLVVARNFAEV